MKIAVGVLGVVGVLLGSLWLLQGLGVVHIKPMLCFANCAPLQEASLTWASVGFAVLAGGALAMRWSLRRTR